MPDRRKSFSQLQPAQPAEIMRPVPFFSRLGVKHGIVLTSLVMMSMIIITGLQLRETLQEIQNGAVEKGRTAGAAVAPLVLPALRTGNLEALHSYFNKISAARGIDYVQVVDSQGRVQVGTNPQPGERQPRKLNPGWLHTFADSPMLDREAVSVPWLGGAGVDVFVALLENPQAATVEDIEAASHLRVGINFDEVVQSDTPRVIWRMVVFTLIVTSVMVLGLFLLLKYILRPVKELHIGLRAVASGDLDYKVPVFSQDEVGRLAQAFNATTARLRAAFQRIEELATRDPLTNLFNRRSFDERLAAEAARSRRYGHPFGLIVMDLDKFKDVNDRYGHPVGDDVLKYVAKVIEANVRETDLPARIGGEEFAVILPESNVKEVSAVAEKLRSAVQQNDVQTVNKQGMNEGIHITLSAGAACSAGHLVTPESMMAAADAALYQSKGQGRNRVTMAPPRAGKTDMLRGIDENTDRPSPTPGSSSTEYKI